MPYLFTRSIRVSGNLVDAMGWSARITEKVNQIAEIPIALWQPIMSAQINTLNWVTVVDDLAALTATDEKLMADSAYLDLMMEGAKFNAGSGVDDQLVKFVHLDPGVENAQYAAVVQAELAPGHFVEGITLGVEIAEKAKELSGFGTSFGQAATGPYAQVGWITTYESIQQLQAAEDKVNSNPEFIAMVDERGGKAYLPGATSTISRKVM